MIVLSAHDTIATAFARACDAHGDRSFLAVAPNGQRSYHPRGYEVSYQDAAAQVAELVLRYRAAGYGPSHRVGLFLENRPEHFLHKLALNTLGAWCVPINADLRAAEIAYVLAHARVDLVVVLADRYRALMQALVEARQPPAVAVFETFEQTLPSAKRLPSQDAVRADTPASILYTSGTTGKPKGCILSHGYELAIGAWYAQLGQMSDLRAGSDRVYNPLPLYHVNAGVTSFFGVLLAGCCQIQGERFQPTRWWREVRDTRATVVHYLGVIVPMLLNQPESELDRTHSVRFGAGAGIEPQLHRVFEERFGFPMLELWGMTEITRVIIANAEPRQVGTRAFGRAVPGLEVRVVERDGEEAAPNQPGELLVRHSEATPRKDFFSGYLDDPEATEDAWRGGWFHTGDIVSRDETGMLHFVDRSKNIIRRSGENIAAAEVEALLLTHPFVAEVAVVAVPDEVREEEVLACIVVKPEAERARLIDQQVRDELARDIFNFCNERLAYYKVPGWILFRDEIPTTGTQKVQKHRLFGKDEDPRAGSTVIDLRAFKGRS